MKFFKRNEPDICPICESNALKYVGDSYDSEYAIDSWLCQNCESAGEQVYVVVGVYDDAEERGNFVGHFDVHDKEGNEWCDEKDYNEEE